MMDENEIGSSEYPGVWGDFDICGPSALLTEIKLE
jgi:hypothetical protein